MNAQVLVGWILMTRFLLKEQKYVELTQKAFDMKESSLDIAWLSIAGSDLAGMSRLLMFVCSNFGSRARV